MTGVAEKLPTQSTSRSRLAQPVIVHVVAPDISWLSLETLRSLQRPSIIPLPQFVFTVGPRAAHATERLGMHPVHSPARLWGLRAMALQRRVAQIILERGVRRILLHAWSPSAARWCALLVDDTHQLIITAPSGTRAKGAVCWPRSGRLRDTPLYACPDEGALHAVRVAGVPADRCHLVAPQLTGDPPRPERVAMLRSRMNLAPGDRVVLIIPPVVRESGSFVATWAGMIVQKLYPTLRFIVPAGRREPLRLERLAVSVKHQPMVRFAPADATLAELAALAELGMFLPPREASANAMGSVLATGLPVIASDVPASREAARSAGLEGDPPGGVYWARPGSVESAARQLLRLLDSPVPRTQLTPPVPFTSDETARRYATIYDLTLGARSPR